MKYINYLIIVLIPLILISCRKDLEFQDFNYTTFNRVVGPKGGTLNFYANYGNDSKNEIIASLTFPPQALDSMMVFNMYQFEDFELASQMADGFAKIGSKFLYFVPFYESEGYHEREQLELNYHLSMKLKDSITVTYHPLADNSDMSLKNWQEIELYNNFYKTTNKAYKVYRIKIPKQDQWGSASNIYVNWTRQGYPNGYDATSLSYIINGRWSATDPWGTGEISMDNWELVGTYNINTAQDVVTFKTDNTDYIYVVARDIYLKNENIPLNIANYIRTNFTADSTILRASYENQRYNIYLADNSLAVFDNYTNFQYRLIQDLTAADLPRTAFLYIQKNYPNNTIKKVIYRIESFQQQYEVMLSGGVTLKFDATGGLIGLTQFNYNPLNLPDSAKAYLKKNFPLSIINNVTLEYTSAVEYIVYLNSNVKVYFNGIGSWYQTIYFKMNSDKVSDKILNYFSSKFPKAIFSQIDYTIWPQGSQYEITLVDNRWFNFSGDGTLLEYEFRNISENELPQLVTAALNKRYPNGYTITTINHIYSDATEWFEIYFSDLTNIMVSPQGTLSKK